MPTPIETWYTDIPPITRIYITAACFTSLAVQLGFVHPLHLWLNYDRILYDFQWWRLVTNFLYFGPISIDYFFHMFFLARYSRMMEEGFFRNKPADYVWLLVFSAGALILLSFIIPHAYIPFLGSPLAFTMVYIWARRNPYVRLNFLGLIVFRAPHLPWVLLCFSLLFGGQLPVGDILGIAVGHIYYFFEDIWPRDSASGGKRWLETPRIILWTLSRNRPNDNAELAENLPEDVEERPSDSGTQQTQTQTQTQTQPQAQPQPHTHTQPQSQSQSESESDHNRLGPNHTSRPESTSRLPEVEGSAN
ncbi:Der1-like family-domain-containing protein [Phycomyces blakesleeanus]